MSVESRRKQREPKTETEKALQAEKAKEGLKAMAIGPVTGLLGLPSDIIDLADMANDAIAKYGKETTIAQFSKLIKPQLDKLQEKYGREQFDKGFTELTGIKSDISRPSQVLGELVSLGSLAKAGVKGAKILGESLSDAYKGTEKLFKTQTDLMRGNNLQTEGVGKLEETKITPKKETDALINPMIIGKNSPEGKEAIKSYENLRKNNPNLSQEEVYLETGVYIGPDGRYRYNLDNRTAKISDTFKKNEDIINVDSFKEGDTKTFLLKEVMDFKKLYPQYDKPFYNINNELVSTKLEDVKVKFIKDKERLGLGSYNFSDDLITINLGSSYVRNSDHWFSSLLHETQHAIQHREGFITGANVEAVIKKNNPKDYEDYINYKNDKITISKEREAELRKAYQKALDEYKDKYGEVEARFVQKIYRDRVKNNLNEFEVRELTPLKEKSIKGTTVFDTGGNKIQNLADSIRFEYEDIIKKASTLEKIPVKKSPALQKISEITKLRDGTLGSRTPMDKDGLPKNLIRGKDGKPLVLYYGDMGKVYDPVTHTYKPTPSGIPGKLTNKFLPSGRTYTTGKKVGNFVTPNPIMASGYASQEGGSVIPVYIIADKVTNIKPRSFLDIDKAGGDAKRGEVFVGDVGFDAAPPVKLEDGREVKDIELLRESKKKYGTDQYTFNKGTQVFSAITGERLTELPTIKQNIRSKLLNLSQKEEDILLKKMSPEDRLKYKNAKTYGIADDEEFINDLFYTFRDMDLKKNLEKRNLAKGGDIMKKQMELFDEGGLKDEGNTVDPVSGNDVPPGATQEEVRDDIPARLSEGEFVFPADVVRFIGLEKLMQMRQKAKAGLARMEEMGQMGNSEEATIPDDAPFSIEDLDMEDETEYNQGGVVKAQTGIYVAPGTGIIQPQTPNTRTTGISSYTAPMIPSTNPTPIGGYKPMFYNQADTEGVTPTFQSIIGRNPGQYDEFREYVNDAGMRLQIPFKDGQPLYPIPEGYTYVDPEATKTEDVKVKEATPQSTSVLQQEQDGGDPEDPPSASIAMGGNKDGKGGQIGGITANVSFNVNPFGLGGPIKGLLDIANIGKGKDVPTIGNEFGITTNPVEMSYGKGKISITAQQYAQVKNNPTGKLAKALTDRLGVLNNIATRSYTINPVTNVYTDPLGNTISTEQAEQAGKDVQNNISQEVSKGRDVQDVIGNLSQTEISMAQDYGIVAEDDAQQDDSQTTGGFDFGDTQPGQDVTTSTGIGTDITDDVEDDDSYQDNNVSSPTTTENNDSDNNSSTDTGSVSEGGYGGVGATAKGGFINKKKMKPKKMKRGGLASRK